MLQVNAHDLHLALKGILYMMSELILGGRMLPLSSKTAALMGSVIRDCGARAQICPTNEGIAEAKHLKTA